MSTKTVCAYPSCTTILSASNRDPAKNPSGLCFACQEEGRGASLKNFAPQERAPRTVRTCVCGSKLYGKRNVCRACRLGLRVAKKEEEPGSENFLAVIQPGEPTTETPTPYVIARIVAASYGIPLENIFTSARGSRRIEAWTRQLATYLAVQDSGSSFNEILECFGITKTVAAHRRRCVVSKMRAPEVAQAIAQIRQRYPHVAFP